MKILSTEDSPSIHTSEEVRDIIISAVVLGVAFTIAFLGGPERFLFILQPSFILYFIPTTLLALLSIVAKEVSQKNAARALESHAFYDIWTPGIILSILSSFLGFVIAAVGGIKVATEYTERYGRWTINLTPKQMGIIATLGPIVYMGISLGFVMLSPLSPTIASGKNVFLLAANMNITLALFSMIPIDPLDGEKILRWNFLIWFFLILMGFAVVGMIRGIL